MSICPHCRAQVPAGADPCPRCGKQLSETSGEGAHNGIQVQLRVVRAEGGTETMVPMTSGLLTCGRRGDIALKDDPFVADLQVRFYFSGTRLAVEDVGGGNGVFRRLRQEREMRLGGELRLGRQRLILESIAPMGQGPDGAIAWGSPDPGYQFRLLQMLEGGVRGAAFPLQPGDNQIGRESGEISFPKDGFISGRHALLHLEGERIRVKDVGSSNGTFLRLDAPAFVESGDQFLVGRELLRVEF